MEMGSNEVIRQSVQAGLGLGLLSHATIEEEIPQLAKRRQYVVRQ